MAMTVRDINIQQCRLLDSELLSLDARFQRFCHLVKEMEKESLPSLHYQVTERVKGLFTQLQQKMKEVKQLTREITEGDLLATYQNRLKCQSDMITHSQFYRRVDDTMIGISHLWESSWKESHAEVNVPDREWNFHGRPHGSFHWLGNTFFVSEKVQASVMTKIISFCDFTAVKSLMSTSHAFNPCIKAERKMRRQLSTPMLQELHKVLGSYSFALNWEQLEKNCHKSWSACEMWNHIEEAVSISVNGDRLTSRDWKLLAARIRGALSNRFISRNLRECFKLSKKEIVSKYYDRIVKLYAEDEVKNIHTHLHSELYSRMPPTEQLQALQTWAKGACGKKIPPEIIHDSLRIFESIVLKHCIRNNSEKLAAFIAISEREHTLQTLEQALMIALAVFETEDRVIALRAVFSTPLPPDILIQIPHLIRSQFHKSHQTLILQAFLQYQGHLLSPKEIFHNSGFFEEDLLFLYGFLWKEPIDEHSPESHFSELASTTISKRGLELIKLSIELRKIFGLLLSDPQNREATLMAREITKGYGEDRDRILYFFCSFLLKNQSYDCVLDLLSEMVDQQLIFVILRDSIQHSSLSPHQKQRIRDIGNNHLSGRMKTRFHKELNFILWMTRKRYVV